MANVGAAEQKKPSWLAMHQPSKSTVFVGLLVLFLTGYVVYPTLLIVVNSFNVAPLPKDPFDFGLDNWTAAFSKPGIFTAIWHTVLLWFLYTTISFPVAVLISWSLARLPIPGSYTLEFFFDTHAAGVDGSSARAPPWSRRPTNATSRDGRRADHVAAVPHTP